MNPKTGDHTSARRIGVISDTHGLLRPEVFTAFQRVEMILHAGDIGGDDILIELEAIAPVVAVRGNMDHGAWLEGIPASRTVRLGGQRIFMVHDPAHVKFDPGVGDLQGVIFGHTHWPHLETRNGILMLNPGSAGYRRGHSPVSLAILTITGEEMRAELIELPCGS